MPRIIPPKSLLQAYAQGVFPMADDGELLWFSPERRGLMPLDERFHVSRSLAKVLRRKPFEIRWSTAFRQVMLGCAERESTWIDELILESYCELHRLGFAHSIECWDGEGLQGGLYGVVLGGAFFGESMFSRKAHASKVAMVAVVERLRDCGYGLFDTQWLTDHLRQFGGYEMPREEYLQVLGRVLEMRPKSWVSGCRKEDEPRMDAD